jgi:hypothetical protein
VYECTLYNCEVASNSFAAADTCTLYNCTLTGNQRGGAWYSTLNNCIAYYNDPSNFSPAFTVSTFNYCCTTPMPSGGVGNITNEPLFVDPANGDFHLQRGSPCINVGSNAYAFGTDLDGNPRIIDGTVDIGAYESPHIGVNRYVWQRSAAPTPPYTSWATAATNIQDAVNASLTGDTILVTNGMYVGGVNVNHPLTLQSVNGPQFTLIDAGGRSANNFSGSTCVSMGSDASVSGFTLTSGFGGNAVGTYGSTHILTNCVIAGGTAYLMAGGASRCTLYNCLLTGNGGGTNGSAAVFCTLYNCTVTGNSADVSSAAVVYRCTLYNCAITENSVAGAGSCVLYNCTLMRNQAGGALDSTLYNCISYYNVNPSPWNPGYANYSGGTLNYCCTIPMPGAGIGNITSEPAFATAWRLSSSSPCRGAGSAGYSSGLDLDGEAWLNPPSIGCDEYYSGSITGALSVASTASLTNVPPGFMVLFDGIIEGRASASRWEFGDGTVESNRLHTSHQWLSPGDYSVVLRAYNNDHQAGTTAVIKIRVTTQMPVNYVDAHSGNPVPPYNDWSTAARSIQDAIAAVSIPGSVVLVTNGAYAGGLTVTNPLLLTSVNGPGFTIIDGGGTNRCVSVLTNANLTGFTITNGSAYNGGGIWSPLLDASIVNCVLVGNSSSFGGGAYGGTLYNCRLSGNTAYWDGGGANSATLYNCTLSGNSSANPRPGGAFACSLNNCIVYYNSPFNHSGCVINYTCTTPISDTGAGNFDTPPLFVDSAAGNFRLQSSSPCIDAGNNAFAYGITDLDGNPRVFDSLVDLGAYEFQSFIPPVIALPPQDKVAPLGSTISFTVGATGTQPLLYQWQFNGMPIANATNSILSLIAITRDQAGVYSVAVSNLLGNASSAGATLTISTGIHFVWSDSPNPALPYTNWATAAHAVQNAVDVALPGDEILITNGTYAGGIVASKPVALRSVNGAMYTVIDGGGTNRCLAISNSVNVVGLTLTNGLADNGGGVWCCSTSAGLTNCVLVGNLAGEGGGAYGGRLYNCLLLSNSAVGGQNWPEGGGAYGSELYYCTIVSNSASFGGGFGGGVSGSLAYGCIIYYNSAQYQGYENYSDSTSGLLNYCCTTPMPAVGLGNFTDAPHFVDEAGGDFRLQSNSPCIDAGNDAFVWAATDLEGNSRISGSAVDIGAYEFQQSGSVIPLAWLQQYGLPSDGSVDYVDTDGDGMNNWQEWVCGTNPTNALSCLRLVSAVPTSSNVTVTWQSVAGINYFLERTTNLVTPFTLVASNIVGQASTTSSADTNASGARPFFYRVGVAHP